MIVERLADLGYEYQPGPVQMLAFHSAVRAGNMVFTSGQIPALDDVAIKGQVGADVDLATAQRAAEICGFNCLRAMGSVVDIESIDRVIKVLGMVNVAEGFDDTPAVINGCTSLLNRLFGEDHTHARSAVGMVLPHNWAVEIEMVATVR